jgi:hypothetical protein
MHGILRQLVKASVKGDRPDEVNLAFMISMVKNFEIEATEPATPSSWSPAPSMPKQ